MKLRDEIAGMVDGILGVCEITSTECAKCDYDDCGKCVAARIIAKVEEVVENVENPYKNQCKGFDDFARGFEKCRKAILKKLKGI